MILFIVAPAVQPMGALALLQALFPIVMGAEVPKEKMAAALEDLSQSLRTLEETFLQSKAFIVGEKVSLADLVAIVEVMQVTIRHACNNTSYM